MPKAPIFKRPSLIPIAPIKFHFRMLSHMAKARLVGLSVVGGVSGLLGLIPPFNWAWYISVIAFIVGVFDIYSMYFVNRTLGIRGSESVPKLCMSLQPSPRERENGYQVIPISDRRDSILISDDVNKFLRGAGSSIRMRLSAGKRFELVERLRVNSELFKDVLIHQHFESRHRRRMFFNDKKISLGSSLLLGTESVVVFPSCYFLSYITNEMAALDVDDLSNRSEPDAVWIGLEHFPYSKGSTSAPNTIKTLETSGMSNHIGGNTIAFTADGRMVLWRQGPSAIRSNGLLAPTGSGSLDYSDYLFREDDALNNLAIKGMERELLEEGHRQGKEVDYFIELTKVIGFYRWVGKGGLPAFLGVTKLKIDAGELFPCAAEVDNPRWIKTSFPAANLTQLTNSIEELERSPHMLSVPLFANLHALKEVIRTDPDFISFIFLDA